MNVPRSIAAVAAVALLGGLAPAPSADDVLVPGSPPLTQAVVDAHTEFMAYLLGIKFDAGGRKTFAGLVVEDWKASDAAAREAFLKQVAEWRRLPASARYGYRARVLPGYLDRQGDAKNPSAAERWALDLYRTLYKKKADERPTARMDKQPPAHAAMNVDFGFPADPKHGNIFDHPVVFTSSQVYMRHPDGNTYVSRDTGATHHSHSYWWFFPTGRYYVRFVRCLGSVRVPGHEKDVLWSTYYLESEQVSDFWGRYAVDEKDRMHLESDKGEKLTTYLAWGRDHMVWQAAVWSAPPRKKK
jgi:hypothetical protein